MNENPKAKVYVLYRDMRTFGERELLFKEAREKGVIFIRYEVDGKPRVEAAGDKVMVTVKGPHPGRATWP